MDLLEECQGLGNLYYVGAYVLLSVPLLENGVESSIRTCHKLGAKCPWNPIFSSKTKFNKKNDIDIENVDNSNNKLMKYTMGISFIGMIFMLHQKK